MKETSGSCKKKRKMVVGEDGDDSLLLSQENVTQQPRSGIATLSEAACAVNALENDPTARQIPDSIYFKQLSLRNLIHFRNKVERSSALRGPLQVPDAEVMRSNGTQGAESSSKDPALVNVEGYCVKKEVAPMLRRIFHVHKDIARDCKMNDRTILVPFLEMICSFCQKLEDLSLNIVDTELEDMVSIVENFGLMGFDVKWLSERLKLFLKDSLALKEDMTKIELKEEDVRILKQKLSTAEAELDMMKVENYKARRKFEQQRMDLDGFLPNINPTDGRVAKVAQANAEREKTDGAQSEMVEVNPPTFPVQQSSSNGADRTTTARTKAEREGRAISLSQPAVSYPYDNQKTKVMYALAVMELNRRARAEIVEVNPSALDVHQSSSSRAGGVTTANVNPSEGRAAKVATALTETVELNPPTLPVQQSSSSGSDGTTSADMNSTDDVREAKLAQTKVEREGEAMPLFQPRDFGSSLKRKTTKDVPHVLRPHLTLRFKSKPGS